MAERRGPKAKIPGSIIHAVRVALLAGETPGKVARRYNISPGWARELREKPAVRIDAPGPIPAELSALPEGRDKDRLVLIWKIATRGIETLESWRAVKTKP